MIKIFQALPALSWQKYFRPRGEPGSRLHVTDNSQILPTSQYSYVLPGWNLKTTHTHNSVYGWSVCSVLQATNMVLSYMHMYILLMTVSIADRWWHMQTLEIQCITVMCLCQFTLTHWLTLIYCQGKRGEEGGKKEDDNPQSGKWVGSNKWWRFRQPFLPSCSCMVGMLLSAFSSLYLSL